MSPRAAAARSRAAAQPEARPSRFGFARVLERLLAYRAEADAAANPAPDAMDRRRVLARLQAELGVTEELLLARGFDRAYRRAVEGV